MPQVRLYGVAVGMYTFAFAVFITQTGSKGKAFAYAVSHFWRHADGGALVVVVVPEFQSSAYVYLGIAGNENKCCNCCKNKLLHNNSFLHINICGVRNGMGLSLFNAKKEPAICGLMIIVVCLYQKL